MEGPVQGTVKTKNKSQKRPPEQISERYKFGRKQHRHHNLLNTSVKNDGGTIIVWGCFGTSAGF